MTMGVVVDVDDTLYLERDYVRSGFEAVGEWCQREWGLDGVGERAWDLFVGGRRRTTLTDALEASGRTVSEPERDRLVEVYRSHTPSITACADAREFLGRHLGRTRLGVITDGPAISQRAKCQALGLMEIADPVLITADLDTSKPDPAIFRLVEDGWSLSGRELVYVADNPQKDFEAPMLLGWQCVRVRRPESLHAELPTPDGVVEVQDLAGVQF